MTRTIPLRRFGLVVLLVLFGNASLFPQSGSLTLSSGSVVAGGTTTVNLSYSGTTAPAGLQWTMTYPPSAFSAVNVAAGPVLASAGKSLYCGGTSGTYTCVAVGMNTNTIANGIVATANVTMAPTAGSTNINVA